MSKPFWILHALLLTLSSELVVSTLVETFVFEEGPHITWEMSAIARPVVTGKRGANAQLPLKVSLAPIV